MAGVSDVTICNLALGHLKKNAIQSRAESSENASKTSAGWFSSS